jgi:hypothetical protein
MSNRLASETGPHNLVSALLVVQNDDLTKNVLMNEHCRSAGGVTRS